MVKVQKGKKAKKTIKCLYVLIVRGLIVVAVSAENRT